MTTPPEPTEPTTQASGDGPAESPAAKAQTNAPTASPTRGGPFGWARRLRASTVVGFRAIPRWVRVTVSALCVAIVGTLLGVQLGGTGTYDVGPFRVDMSIRPSLHGDTRVEIPPLGSITLDSHAGPTQLDARIRQLDDEKTKELVEHPEKIESESKTAADDVEKAVKNLLIRVAIVVAVVSLLLGLLLFRSFGRATLTCFLALTILGSALGMAWGTLRPESVREPKYQGLLTNVPAVVGNAQSIQDRFGEYRGSLIKIVRDMSRVYGNLSSLPTYEPDPNTIRVLHISDMHLNPTSYDVVDTISKQFKVDAIVDTGDLTDWGSDQENEYAKNIGRMSVPYVFVRGNHDRESTAAAVAAQPNAVVLENEVREVAGLRFAGIGDPRYTPDKSAGDLAKEEDRAIGAGKKLARTVSRYDKDNDRPVDVAMIHDPAAAPTLKNSAPLVLCGHTHKRAVKRLDKDTLLRVEGSTGARGLRGLYKENDPDPIRMSLLYFSKDGKLTAYDEITIGGIGQSKVELNRTVLANAPN